MINLVLYLKIITHRKEYLALQKGLQNNQALKEVHKSYQTSILNEENKFQIINRLQEAMEKDKLYLDSNLTLDALSNQLNVSKHHLTEVLNVGLATNFYNYVNTCRVNEAARLIEESQENCLMLEICYHCGFKSKSTFNKYFKEIKGMTPKEYRQHAVLSLP